MGPMYFIRGTCYGCKTAFEVVVSRYEYQRKCPNPDCVQYVSFSPFDGDPVMDICPDCKRAAHDHRWIYNNMICKPQGVTQ